MTREEVRNLASQIIEGPCPEDDVAIQMTSLQQLEFAFALEEDLEFRHQLPEDLAWKCINDVIQWLKEKGEYNEEKA